jgi:hypothetical protein
MGPESFLPHMAGSVAYTIIGYLGSRFFAFSQTQGSRLADASPPI